MIFLAAHRVDGRYVTAEFNKFSDLTLEQWGRELLPEGLVDEFQVIWLDLEAATPEEMAWLGRRFRFHPLALEDCTHFDQRPKIEEYSNHVFLVVHGLCPGADKDLGIYELHAFLTKNLVVTVHDAPIDAITTYRSRLSGDRKLLPMQEDFVLHRILDRSMDANPAALERIEEELETIEDEIAHQFHPSHLERIATFRRQLGQVRRMMIPLREIYSSFAKGEYEEITEASRMYYRDVHDHCVRIIDSVDDLRERLHAVQDAYQALAAQRTNDTMRRLTVFSALFLPLTFVTGFFGMNFEAIPWSHGGLFKVTMAIVLVVPVALVFWFRKNRWTD